MVASNYLMSWWLVHICQLHSAHYSLGDNYVIKPFNLSINEIMMIAKVCLLEGLPDDSWFSGLSLSFTILCKSAFLLGIHKWPLFCRLHAVCMFVMLHLTGKMQLFVSLSSDIFHHLVPNCECHNFWWGLESEGLNLINQKSIGFKPWSYLYAPILTLYHLPIVAFERG